jgi:hypothetical protein
MNNLLAINNLIRLGGKSSNIFNPSSIEGLSQWLFKEQNTSTQAVDKVGTRSGTVFAGRAWNPDNVNDELKVAGVGASEISEVSAIGVDGSIITLSKSYSAMVHTIDLGGDKIFNVKLWSQFASPTDEEKRAVTIEGSGGQSELFAWYKCDGGISADIALDSSGNENHSTSLTASGCTLSTFHTTDAGVTYSWLNQVGYSDGTGGYAGVQIPRDESNITKDVLGNDLQHVGLVKMNSDLKESNCATPDGTNDYAQFNYDLTGVSITSYEGTATPTIDTVNDRITLTAGTFYNLVLSDGNEFPICEGGGTKSECVTDDDKHITWVNTTEASFWAGRQDTLHYNIRYGCTIITHATNQTKYIPYQKDGTPTQYITAIGETKTEAPAGAFHNSAETKLLVPPAPSLLDKFAHGGTFDGSHYVTTDTPLNATSSYDITLNLKDITVANCNIIDARDGNNDGIVFWYVNSLSILRFLHNTTSIDIQASGIDDGKYRFTWDGSTVSIYKDGVLIVSQSDSSSISTESNLRIGSRNFISPVNNVIGRISGVKVIADGVTVIDEPLNGTLNDATLTGSADTFWVEEYNNLFFDASGVPVSYGYDDIQPNYLGINQIMSDTSVENKKKNTLVFSTPLSGSDLAKVKKYLKQ